MIKLSEFKFIPYDIQRNLVKATEEQFKTSFQLEIAYQLKRIADILENKELAMKVREW